MRFLAVTALLFFAGAAASTVCATADSTIHGNIYDWSTLNTINDAIVNVYTMPGQTFFDRYVVPAGNYSFSLPDGDYMLVATAGAAGTPTELTATENFTVQDSVDRTIDLILFPPGSLNDLAGFINDTNATPTLSPGDVPTTQPSAVPSVQPSTQPSATPAQGASSNWVLYLGAAAIILAVLAIIAGLVLLRKIKPRRPADEPAASRRTESIAPAPVKPEPEVPREEQAPATQPQPEPQAQPPQPSVQDLLLPEDCREVLAIMEKNGGRITQLDLRKALPYSEAKVSLIVSDLESRGLIKKIKKGRGNVLILNRDH